MSKIKVSEKQIQVVRNYIEANPGTTGTDLEKKISSAIVWAALSQLKSTNDISGVKIGRGIGYSVTEAKQATVVAAKSTAGKKEKKNVSAKISPTVEPVEVKSDKSKGRNFGRNFGRLMIDGVPMHKGKAALAIVAAYVKAKNPTYKELKDVFPDSLLKTYGIFVEYNVAKQKAGRYFHTKSITLKDGKRIAVCSQFTTDNIQPLLTVARKLSIVKISQEKIITLKDGKRIAICSQFTTDNIQPLLTVARKLSIVKISQEK